MTASNFPPRQADEQPAPARSRNMQVQSDDNQPLDAAGAAAPLAWAREFLNEYFSDEPCDFHRAFMGLLAAGDRRLLALVAPRGHAKSTCAAFAYPLWCICHRRRRNIVIITHESSLATQFVRDIRAELETNERIRDAYGDLFADTNADEPADNSRKGGRRRRARPKNAEGKFTTATGVTVQAKGCGASFRGMRVGPHRPDLIICDDIEKDEHVAIPEQRAKLEHWLRRVVMPALAPDGELVVLGSIIHYDSLLANLRDRRRFPRWEYRVYRALEARSTGPGGAHRLEALWPARWSVERLQLERERIGTLAFEQEYQANPIDDSVRVFREEWLNKAMPPQVSAERLIPLMAVDPATGVQGGDFFAVWVGAVDTADGVIYTRRLLLERIGIVRQVRQILELYEQYRPVRIGIETTAYQVALKDALTEEGRRRGLYLPVKALTTITNKRARIESIAPLLENGSFKLPTDLSPEAESQFLHFPKARHDDAPDVCAMGVELARSYRTGSLGDGATTGGRGVRRDDW